MRLTSPIMLSVAFLALTGEEVLAQDYLTKEGQLTQPLRIVQLQGGFAGFTGVQYTIAPDGSWTSESIFNEKKTPKNKGKLSEKDLAKLGALLEKYDLAKLPEKSGKAPGANPHTITLEYGKMKVSLVGQVPPKLDPKKPTDTVESRFAGIWEGVVGLLSPPVPPKKEDGKPLRTLNHFQKTLDKSFTPAQTAATFGEPNRQLGSGLIIYEYDLDDGTKMRLGFPGFAPIMYAHHVQKNGEFTVIPLK